MKSRSQHVLDLLFVVFAMSCIGMRVHAQIGPVDGFVAIYDSAYDARAIPKPVMAATNGFTAYSYFTPGVRPGAGLHEQQPLLHASVSGTFTGFGTGGGASIEFTRDQIFMWISPNGIPVPQEMTIESDASGLYGEAILNSPEGILGAGATGSVNGPFYREGMVAAGLPGTFAPPGDERLTDILASVYYELDHYDTNIPTATGSHLEEPIIKTLGDAMVSLRTWTSATASALSSYFPTGATSSAFSEGEVYLSTPFPYNYNFPGNGADY